MWPDCSGILDFIPALQTEKICRHSVVRGDGQYVSHLIPASCRICLPSLTPAITEYHHRHHEETTFPLLLELGVYLVIPTHSSCIKPNPPSSVEGGICPIRGLDRVTLELLQCTLVAGLMLFIAFIVGSHYALHTYFPSVWSKSPRSKAPPSATQPPARTLILLKSGSFTMQSTFFLGLQKGAGLI